MATMSSYEDGHSDIEVNPYGRERSSRDRLQGYELGRLVGGGEFV